MTATTDTRLDTCAWVMLEGYNEDGSALLSDCGAVVTEDSRGWECAYGHRYVTAHARAAEGWDYAEDAAEAASLIKHGTEPRDLVTGRPWQWD